MDLFSKPATVEPYEVPLALPGLTGRVTHEDFTVESASARFTYSLANERARLEHERWAQQRTTQPLREQKPEKPVDFPYTPNTGHTLEESYKSIYIPHSISRDKGRGFSFNSDPLSEIIGKFDLPGYLERHTPMNAALVLYAPRVEGQQPTVLVTVQGNYAKPEAPGTFEIEEITIAQDGWLAALGISQEGDRLEAEIGAKDNVKDTVERHLGELQVHDAYLTFLRELHARSGSTTSIGLHGDIRIPQVIKTALHLGRKV